MKELFTGLHSKFTALSGGLHNAAHIALSGRLYNTVAPQGSAYPYAVFQLVSGAPDWTFTEDFESALIQISIFDNGTSSGTVCDIYSAINDLFDNCALSVSGYDHIYMWRESNQLIRDEEEGTWQYIVQYRIYLEEQ